MKASHERCKGVLGNALGKLSLMWHDGVFLGVKGRTGEHIIGDRKGVWKTRTLQRRPESERWSSRNAECVTGVPWNVSAEDPNPDGEQMEVIRVGLGEAGEEAKTKDDDDITVPRRWKISKQDLLTHGFSAKCAGCKAILARRPGSRAAATISMVASPTSGTSSLNNSITRVGAVRLTNSCGPLSSERTS